MRPFPRSVRSMSLALATFALSVASACSDTHSGDESKDADSHICEGDRWSSVTAAELMELAECTRITGNLSITGSEETLALPKLVRVDGNLSIWGNRELRHVALVKLESVGGWLDIGYNEALASFDLPALERSNDRGVQAHWDFSIIGNGKLPRCAAEAAGMQLVARGFTGTIEIKNNLDSCPGD
jgi:hypothetical protein